MKFTLRVNPSALALIAAHGVSDVQKPIPHLATYALALCPVPGTSAAFGVSSIVHFAKDIGIVGSVLLHTVLCVIATVNLRLACGVLQVYMCVLHIPAMLLALALRAEWTAIASIAVATAAALAVRSRIAPGGVFVLGEIMQRIVVVHTILNIEPLTTQNVCLLSYPE